MILGIIRTAKIRSYKGNEPSLVLYYSTSLEKNSNGNISPPDASDWSVNYNAEVSNLIFSLSKNCVRPAAFPVILGEFRCNVGTQFKAFSTHWHGGNCPGYQTGIRQ